MPWYTTTIVSANALNGVVDKLKVGGFTTPNLRFFRNFVNSWGIPLNLAFAINKWGYADQVQSSPEIVVPDKTQLQPGTALLAEYPDGSALVKGSTGMCGNPAFITHAEMIRFADVTRIGFPFCTGFLWKYRDRGDGTTAAHAQGCLVTPELEFYTYEPRAAREKFFYSPFDSTPEEFGQIHWLVF